MSDPISSFPPPAPQPHSDTIFHGPNGIRAGWRALIFLAIGFALFLGLTQIAARIPGVDLRKPELSPLLTIVRDGIFFLSAFISALLMSKIEDRNVGVYGLPGRNAFGRKFWIGACAGFLGVNVVLLAIAAFHGFHLQNLALHGSDLLRVTVSWTIAFVLVGLAEEFLFRGYLQYTLTTGIGFWPAALLLSALFALVHTQNPGEDKIGLISIVVFALVFCLILRRTGDLWWIVGFHAGWDWTQTFFYGVPDSGILPKGNLFNSTFTGPTWLTGGSVGPEASVFTPVVLILIAIVISRVYRENRYPAPRARL
ncbi:MAG TPA: type II CAAX endopeptidase family protein [Candidatus Sulfotelmatobacter sp.]|nr:type II CAAX endopeptidase family protein [Candidatus Sulfotelmatobacter sp.]